MYFFRLVLKLESTISESNNFCLSKFNRFSSANSSAIFTGLNVPASKHVDVLITFANAEPMKLDVLVREKAEYYASVGN